MNKQEAWNKFSMTGSVADYLSFKAIEKEQKKNITEENENKNHGTDSKTTEYW